MVSVAAMRRCPLVTQIGHWHVYSISLSTISYAGGLIDETKHFASDGLGIGRYANSRTAQTVKVQSLMGDGYTVAGVVSAPAGGAAVFLQKGNVLVFCFVIEKSDSASPIRNIASQ